MLETSRLDVGTKPATGVNWDRRRAELRRGLVRLLRLTGGMTVEQREAVRRALDLTLMVERAAAEGGAPLAEVIRADRAAAKARAHVATLANETQRPATVTTDWLRGSHGSTAR
jgi:hypothetical protein